MSGPVLCCDAHFQNSPDSNVRSSIYKSIIYRDARPFLELQPNGNVSSVLSGLVCISLFSMTPPSKIKAVMYILFSIYKSPLRAALPQYCLV